MMEIGITQRGIDELRKTLKDLPAEVEAKAVQLGAEKQGHVVAQAARGLVPVKTGRLKASIRVRRGVVRAEGGGRTKGAKVVAGSKTVVYAPYIEFSEFDTRTKKDLRFIRPAMRQHRSRQVAEFKKGVERGMVLAARAARRRAR